MESHSLHNELLKIKYFGLNLTKEVKISTIKSRTLKKELAADLRKWKDLPCFWVDKINIIKMVILLKAVHRFNAVFIKISVTFFKELEKSSLNSFIRVRDPGYPKQS